MSRTSVSMSVLLLIVLLSRVPESDAAPSSDFGQFLNNMGDRLSRTAATIKDYLLELFYRFRAFFMGHTESTHHQMTAHGCGYATDNYPSFYNRQPAVVSKIRGGGDALWHTW